MKAESDDKEALKDLIDQEQALKGEKLKLL